MTDDLSVTRRLEVATDRWRAPRVSRVYNLDTDLGQWEQGEEERLLHEHGYRVVGEQTMGGGYRPKRAASKGGGLGALLPAEWERIGGRRTVTYERLSRQEP